MKCMAGMARKSLWTCRVVSEVNSLPSKEAIKVEMLDRVTLQSALLISFWWGKPLEHFYMYLFLVKLCEHSLLCIFFCIWLFLFFQERNFLRRKAVLTIWPQVYLGIPSANISLSACDQRWRCATILIWHSEALAGSTIWHILAHWHLWSSHALWRKCLCKSSTVQNAFRPIPGLISCAGVIGRWWLLSCAQNAVSCLTLSKRLVEAPRKHCLHATGPSCNCLLFEDRNHNVIDA